MHHWLPVACCVRRAAQGNLISRAGWCVLLAEADWSRLVHQLRAGDCTPFLGAGACAGVLPGGSGLSKDWAAKVGYPFADKGALSEVMEYAAFVLGDNIYLKEQVCKYLSSLGSPRFDDPDEPHALLSEFPVSVYITTNYDDYLSRALKRAGRFPQSGICAWSGSVTSQQDGREAVPVIAPAPDAPLVYHLHGSAQAPRSLVLTEADYLEFLVNIACSGSGGPGLIPDCVTAAITDMPLLFIGYSLRDWTFKVIAHGILRRIPQIFRRRNVSIQLLPPVDMSITDAEDRARKFLEHIFATQWNISIFWGTAAEFCREIRKRQ